MSAMTSITNRHKFSAVPVTAYSMKLRSLKYLKAADIIRVDSLGFEPRASLPCSEGSALRASQPSAPRRKGAHGFGSNRPLVHPSAFGHRCRTAQQSSCGRLQQHPCSNQPHHEKPSKTTSTTSNTNSQQPPSQTTDTGWNNSSSGPTKPASTT